MGRVVQQELALVQGFIDERKVAVLQVAQAAMHQLGGDAARAGGEVALVDQGNSKAAERSIERHPGAGDAAAQDQEVEGLVLKSVYRPFHKSKRQANR